MSLGEHYGKLRQERGFSLRQAARNDLTASALSRFENGKTELSASQFVRAMANLQLNWNEFDAALPEQSSFLAQIDTAYLMGNQPFLEKVINAADAAGQPLTANFGRLQGNIYRNMAFPHFDTVIQTLYTAITSVSQWRILEFHIAEDLILKLPAHQVDPFMISVIRQYERAQSRGVTGDYVTGNTLLRAALRKLAQDPPEIDRAHAYFDQVVRQRNWEDEYLIGGELLANETAASPTFTKTQTLFQFWQAIGKDNDYFRQLVAPILQRQGFLQ
ncbi:helix-turn-helix domain-containing protein [Schleiferilactobacillus perolens]|uniref:HTH cro/C1-type domain-containing protein n=1 Tax=Schleiferilactobacillus perolens DSM 12744 TaxID=1423792 RepID=A0A0R1N2F2_9LACO|nr:helix-turn-helix transcriptional regulator [Schleiferilactobacillus perolens]KRL14384.1 hypothetical protein FD09_GL000029 [Schleiferilactobacillus perolens DSM 12744]